MSVKQHASSEAGQVNSTAEPVSVPIDYETQSLVCIDKVKQAVATFARRTVALESNNKCTELDDDDDDEQSISLVWSDDDTIDDGSDIDQMLLSCDVCSRSFFTEPELLKHRSADHSPEPLKGPPQLNTELDLRVEGEDQSVENCDDCKVSISSEEHKIWCISKSLHRLSDEQTDRLKQTLLYGSNLNSAQLTVSDKSLTLKHEPGESDLSFPLPIEVSKLKSEQCEEMSWQNPQVMSVRSDETADNGPEMSL